MYSTLDILQQHYGAVMTLNQLALTLSRKPQGLRMALLSGTQPWARELNAKKIYIGRRMYFPIDVVADLLAGGMDLE